MFNSDPLSNIQSKSTTKPLKPRDKSGFDRVRVVRMKKWQGALSPSHAVLTEIKMFDLLKEKSGKELKKELSLLAFNPNRHVDGQENPLINCLLANEMLLESTNLIKEFSDELDPNQRDFEQKTALIIAAKVYSADKQFLELLQNLKHNIKDLDAQDKEGCTALHYLCAYGKINLVIELLKAGADINVQDRQGRTPLDYANMLSEKEVREILKSIYIDPERDENAQCDSLHDYISGVKYFSDPSDSPELPPLANLKALELFEKYVRSKKFLENDSPENREKYIKRCTELKKIFVGKSVIDACMDRKKNLLTELNKRGIPLTSPYIKKAEFLTAYQKEIEQSSKAVWENAGGVLFYAKNSFTMK